MITKKRKGVKNKCNLQLIMFTNIHELSQSERLYITETQLKGKHWKRIVKKNNYNNSYIQSAKQKHH